MRGGYAVVALDYFAYNKTWCLEIEETFRTFLTGTTMRFAFKPMNGAKREFVHTLAEVWGFDADSIDHEPFRR
jgi:transcriptional repressor NF-X1